MSVSSALVHSRMAGSQSAAGAGETKGTGNCKSLRWEEVVKGPIILDLKSSSFCEECIVSSEKIKRESPRSKMLTGQLDLDQHWALR